MPDLSHKASATYWSNFMDPMIYKVITFMESVEDWTMDDNPLLEEAIDALGSALNDLDNIDMSTLGHEDAFIRIAGNIKTGRGLMLLQSIDLVHPGSASRVLVHAEESSMSRDDPAGFFLKRNVTFERLRLLSRIFSEQRLKLVRKALEGDE